MKAITPPRLMPLFQSTPERQTNPRAAGKLLSFRHASLR
jgi:hypothetical protein